MLCTLVAFLWEIISSLYIHFTRTGTRIREERIWVKKAFVITYYRVNYQRFGLNFISCRYSAHSLSIRKADYQRCTAVISYFAADDQECNDVLEHDLQILATWSLLVVQDDIITEIIYHKLSACIPGVINNRSTAWLFHCQLCRYSAAKLGNVDTTW